MQQIIRNPPEIARFLGLSSTGEVEANEGRITRSRVKMSDVSTVAIDTVANLHISQNVGLPPVLTRRKTFLDVEYAEEDEYDGDYQPVR